MAKKMYPATLEITNCSKCPNLVAERYYTADSWEQVYNWFCEAKDNKKIQGYVEWNDKIDIPKWCPLRVKRNKL